MASYKFCDYFFYRYVRNYGKILDNSFVEPTFFKEAPDAPSSFEEFERLYLTRVKSTEPFLDDEFTLKIQGDHFFNDIPDFLDKINKQIFTVGVTLKTTIGPNWATGDLANLVEKASGDTYVLNVKNEALWKLAREMEKVRKIGGAYEENSGLFKKRRNPAFYTTGKGKKLVHIDKETLKQDKSLVDDENSKAYGHIQRAFLECLVQKKAGFEFMEQFVSDPPGTAEATVLIDEFIRSCADCDNADTHVHDVFRPIANLDKLSEEDEAMSTGFLKPEEKERLTKKANWHKDLLLTDSSHPRPFTLGQLEALYLFSNDKLESLSTDTAMKPLLDGHRLVIPPNRLSYAEKRFIFAFGKLSIDQDLEPRATAAAKYEALKAYWDFLVSQIFYLCFGAKSLEAWLVKFRGTVVALQAHLPAQ